ncbi:MAG: deoxyuridine 5'-triphosphate nucleotidohydrolase [Lachnospiraceae bacterium]|nr:deoxyuridine 5'-triphosphate nucleotidohydrolase [Lachnospiraceae bacterium]
MEFEYTAAPRIASFSKVSRERFVADFSDAFPAEAGRADEVYDRIKLPVRATKGSAGYDFFMPVSVTLAPGETVKIPTGIRVEMAESFVLMLFPRSGLGFKYRLQLNNTVGVIDSDYFYSDNEGHIFAKVTNDSNEEKTVTLEEGTGFMQGVFLPYGVTMEDKVGSIRNGGFGSTTKK